jgi:hypothetical protein
MDGPDVLPKNTNEKKDNGAEEKQTDQGGGNPQRKPLPKQQFINQIPAPDKEAEE